VIESAIGIAEDKLEHIFERFLQVDATDRRRLGLGLYISKCIVQGHGDGSGPRASWARGAPSASLSRSQPRPDAPPSRARSAPRGAAHGPPISPGKEPRDGAGPGAWQFLHFGA
jgi:hypothetical protein